MTHDDDDDVLAPVDLHAWRVPPPAPLDRPSLFARVLSPAAAPRRARMAWVFAALAVANVVLVAALVIIISQRPAPSTVTVLPAGGGSGDARVGDLVRRLEQEQRAVERKLAELQELRAAVDQLSDRVRKCEDTERRDRNEVQPPLEAPASSAPAPCDEVSCVLSNYEGACCVKFKRARDAQRASLPEFLNRVAVSSGIAAVRAEVFACGRSSTGTGTVKVKVRVDPSGHVTSATIDSTFDPALGACVASALSKATFARTLRGGSFSYPFRFSGSP